MGKNTTWRKAARWSVGWHVLCPDVGGMQVQSSRGGLVLAVAGLAPDAVEKAETR